MIGMLKYSKDEQNFAFSVLVFYNLYYCLGYKERSHSLSPTFELSVFIFKH